MNKNTKTLSLAILLSLGITACSSNTKETNVSGVPNTAAATANATAKKEAQEAQARAEAAEKAAQESKAKAEAAERAAQEAQAKAEAAQKAADSAKTGTDTKTIEEAQAQAEAAKKEAESAQAQAEAAKKEAEIAQAQVEVAKKDAESAQAQAEAAKKAAEEAEAKAKRAQEEAAAELAKLEAEKRSAEEREKRAKADKIANNLVSSYFIKDDTSQTAQILNDPIKKTALITTIQNKSGGCNQNWGINCYSYNRGVKTGDVIFTESSSYAGYAVVRENYDDTNKQAVPVNSYIAVVTTPTKDKTMVTDATYTGTATYTTKNQQNLVGYTNKGYNAALTLSVKDSVVSGMIARTTGKQDTLVTFNNATVQVGNDNVVFEGTATFDPKIGLSTEQSGTYRGQFAGAQAEQVVGTFETDRSDKDSSVQGAFIGAK